MLALPQRDVNRRNRMGELWRRAVWWESLNGMLVQAAEPNDPYLQLLGPLIFLLNLLVPVLPQQAQDMAVIISRDRSAALRPYRGYNLLKSRCIPERRIVMDSVGNHVGNLPKLSEKG